MRTLVVLATVLVAAACGTDKPQSSAQRSPRSGLARADTTSSAMAVPATPSGPPASAAGTSEIPTGFAIEADSVLRALLPRLAFAFEGAAPSLEECDLMDEGLPPAFAATSLRVLADKPPRTHLERDPDDGKLSYLATFAVEISSVAALRQPDGVGQAKRFDATVKSRIDTAEMLVARAQLSGKWSVCEPLRYRDGSPLEPWSFVQASDTSVHVEHWDPPTMSWRALADTARASTRRPES